MFDLSGKTALVTGGSRGLGVIFAEALARAGADIMLTARSREALEEQSSLLADSTGRKVSAFPGDVTSESDVNAVVATALETHGQIDILVNNAGISDLRGLPSEHSETDSFRDILDTDVVGVFHFAKACGRHMLARGRGSIINIASTMGEGGGEFVTPAYYAAKGAVLQLTRQLAVEWADRGVRANALSPWFFVTDMNRPLFEMVGMAPWVESRTPARRLGSPEDLVGPIVFLASDEASYVTGVNLAVDGGMGASRGAWQIRPGHHYWNEPEAAMIGTPYEGIVPLPNDEWKRGIPGLHYEA